MLALKSLITLIGTAASLATSSYLGTSVSSKEQPQVSLTSTSTQEAKEEATVAPKEVKEAVETVETIQTPAVTEIAEVEVQEVIKPPVEAKEVIYVSRVTLRREFAGIRRPGKPLTGAYELINNFFGKAEEIKSKDQGLWAEFVRDFARSTDEDTLEAACRGYSNRDAASYINNQWLKGKIRDYCYVQIGFKL